MGPTSFDVICGLPDLTLMVLVLPLTICWEGATELSSTCNMVLGWGGSLVLPVAEVPLSGDGVSMVRRQRGCLIMVITVGVGV